MNRVLGIAIGAATVAAGAFLATTLSGQPVAADHHEIEKAVAVVTPRSDSEVSGVITFTKVDGGVQVEAHITGLTPGQEHGFHVHQFGDITAADGTSTGGHFNPHGADHAGPDADMRHTGDLGNLKADDKGAAHYSRLDKHLSLDMTDEDCIIGRGIVIHAGTDDLTSQPTGDAGGRIGVAVIGVGKSE